MILHDADLEGTAQSTAPDCTNDLSSRQPDQSCEIPPSHSAEGVCDPGYSVVPLSPMRPSVKRRSSPGPAEEEPRKKGRDNSESDDVFAAAPRQAHAESRPTSQRPNKTLQPSRSKAARHPVFRSDTTTKTTRGGPKVLTSSSTSTDPFLHPAKATADTGSNARPRHLTASRSRTIHDQNLVDSASSSSLAASRSGDVLGDELPAGHEPRRLPQRWLSSSTPAINASTLTRPVRKPLIDKPVCLMLFISSPSLRWISCVWTHSFSRASTSFIS